MFKIPEYDCYHGTTKENALSIVAGKEFINKQRKNHWLGQGVYFFIDDYDKGLFWAQNACKYKKTKKTAVMCMKILVSESNLLNLDSEKGLNEMDTYAKYFDSILKQAGIKVSFQNEHEYHCKIIDSYCEENKDCFAVKRSFDSTNQKIGLKIGMRHLSPQLCVKNQDIIPFDNISCIIK